VHSELKLEGRSLHAAVPGYATGLSVADRAVTPAGDM